MKITRLNILLNFVLILSCFTLVSKKANAQASWEQFGQNRVQYRTFDWSYYDSTHFRVFFYDKAKSNANYCLNIAEEELTQIVYIMGGRLQKKLNIILYNTFGDYRQTNLGRKNDQINEANGGKLDVVGDNIPIYFNGDHANLRKQIRKGISSVIKNEMLFGDNIKDAVKNAVKMNLPEWYTLGYVEYISNDWTPANESQLQSLMSTNKKHSFLDLSIINPILVGHSFWNFIAETYGENSISNLLYLTRYRKSVNNALEIVINKPAKAIYNEWEQQYLLSSELNKLTIDTISKRNLIAEIKAKEGATYSQFSMSPTGSEIAYVLKSEGQYRVMVQDVKYNKNIEIIDGGIKAAQELADPDYPLLTWSPSGNQLAVIYQKNNNLMLRIFRNGSRKMENKVISPRKVDRITGVCFMSDENTLAITAIKKGQSDLMKLYIKNAKVEPISQDLFDDKNPVLVQNGVNSGILFLSNRTTPYLGDNSKSDAFNDHYNLYMYDPAKGTNLIQLSNTKSEIIQPMQWGLEGFCYMEHAQNATQRKIVKIEKRAPLDDTFSVSDAAPMNFINLKQDYIHKSSKVVEVTRVGKQIKVFLTPQFTLSEMDKAYQEELAKLPVDTSMEKVVVEKSNINYVTPFDLDTTKSELLEEIFTNAKVRSSRYQVYEQAIAKVKPKKYQTSFYPDFIQTSLDNTLLFTRYQPFGYNGGQFQNQSLAGFLTSSLTDVMEDYKVMGGARLSADFRTLDYFLKYNNFRKRIDWAVLYYHQSHSNLYDFKDGVPPNYSPYPVLGKVGTDYFQSSWTYPFDIRQSIRLSLAARYDRIRVKAQDQYSIAIQDDQQYWAVSRAEYVFDNTINPMLNIWKGSRAKLFAEYQYKLNSPSKGFYNFGFDARNYQTIYKNVIVASRIAGAFCGGNAKILYFLGGVDNDLNPKFDANTQIDYSQNYAFQSLATNMRGYRQGFRNGNSYMVVNEEVRLPIYSTFFKKPIKSGFIRNMQLVAFTDIGSAWKGILPNSDNLNNPIAIQDQNGSVIVYLNNSKYDFGMGYGLGLRTRIIGYFIRTDFAWNIEGSKKPLIHISMATDF